jgi:hypothetical protein
MMVTLKVFTTPIYPMCKARKLLLLNEIYMNINRHHQKKTPLQDLRSYRVSDVCTICCI